MISPKTLTELLEYDSETGVLHWKPRPLSLFHSGVRSAEWQATAWNSKNAGKEAFTADNGRGYRRGTICLTGKAKQYLAHRVIWAITYGIWPVLKMDHIDGNGFNNRITNLRLATDAENARNCRPSLGSTSKYLGVWWRPSRAKRQTSFKGRWVAQITVDRQRIVIGSFDDEVGAANAYNAAARDRFGAFARLNDTKA